MKKLSESTLKDSLEEFVFFEASAGLRPTKEQRLLYIATALLTTLIPIYLYQTIYDMDLETYAAIFGVVTVFSALIISFAYHNVTYWLKTRLLKERDVLLTKKKVGAKKEQLEVNTVREAMAFAILYNNLFFLLATVSLSFFVFSSTSAPYNYILSVSTAAAFLTFISTTSTFLQ